MDPLTIAGLFSTGIGAVNMLFGNDPEEETRRLQQRRLQQALFESGNFHKDYDEIMGILGPRLAFANKQAELAKRGGAQSAQADMRRQLGAGGAPIASAISAGVNAGISNDTNTLRGLAVSDAMDSAKRQAMMRAQMMIGAPLQQSTGQRTQQVSGLFNNLGLGLGYLGSQQQGQRPNQTTGIPFMSAMNPPQMFGPQNFGG